VHILLLASAAVDTYSFYAYEVLHRSLQDPKTLGSTVERYRFIDGGFWLSMSILESFLDQLSLDIVSSFAMLRLMLLKFSCDVFLFLRVDDSRVCWERGLVTVYVLRNADVWVYDPWSPPVVIGLYVFV